VEYYEKIKDSNQQIKTVYEWVKEYSSFNDNQKNIYDLAKSKNINSLKNNKKNIKINYSTNPPDYKKLKRLSTYNTPHVTLAYKAFGTVGCGTIPNSNTIIGETKNEFNINNPSLSNKTNSVNPHQRNSYVNNKTKSDFIVVKGTNNIFSKEKNEDFNLKENRSKYNNYKCYNNNSSEISDKGPKLTEFIATYNDKTSKRNSYHVNQSFSNASKKENQASFKKNEKIKSNISKTKSDFRVFSKSPEKINSSSEDFCNNKFIRGKHNSITKTQNVIKKNDKKLKKNINNKNSSNLNISTLTNTINNSHLINSQSISFTKKLLEDSYVSFSKSPYNFIISSSNNQSDQLNSISTIPKYFKVHTPVKPISKLNLNLKSNKKGYSNKLNDSKKIPNSINKFNPNNSLNKTINDININRNTIINSSLKGKKTFNEHFLSKYSKNQNNSYKYNGILKYHNNSNANNNFFNKKKNEIQFSRRKSRSYNEKEFRANGIGINIINDNSKIEVEEENEIDKSDNDVFDGLTIKDDADKNNNILNLLNQQNKKIHVQVDIKAKEEFLEEKIIKKDSGNLNDKTFNISDKINSENSKSDLDKGKSLYNSINSLKTIKSRRSIISNHSKMSFKDENELNNLFENINSNNRKGKKLLNKAKSICENGNKIKGEGADSHNIFNQIIVFEKINEDEKDLLIYSARMNKNEKSSKHDLNQRSNEKVELDKNKMGIKSEKRINNFNKYYIFEKIYKILEKRNLNTFHKLEYYNEYDDNQNYITFNNLKNSPEKHINFDLSKNHTNSNLINKDNNEIVEILTTDFNKILAKIPNKKYINILKNFDDNLKKIESPDFNIFDLKTFVGSENILPVLGSYIFSISDYFSFLNKRNFENFIYEISRGYIKENYYHNDVHGADVTQSSYMYLTKGNLKEVIFF